MPLNFARIAIAITISFTGLLGSAQYSSGQIASAPPAATEQSEAPESDSGADSATPDSTRHQTRPSKLLEKLLGKRRKPIRLPHKHLPHNHRNRAVLLKVLTLTVAPQRLRFSPMMLWFWECSLEFWPSFFGHTACSIPSLLVFTKSFPCSCCATFSLRC